eukprot:6500381-Prymnesium_polylepis.1
MHETHERYCTSNARVLRDSRARRGRAAHHSGHAHGDHARLAQWAPALSCAVTSPWLYPDPPKSGAARKSTVRTASRSTVRTASQGAPSSSFFQGSHQEGSAHEQRAQPLTGEVADFELLWLAAAALTAAIWVP